MFKEHHQVPPKMLQSRKNDYGLIGKQGQDGNIRSRKELMRSAKMHADTDLHQWCFRKEEIHQKEEKTFEDTNEEVVKNNVRAPLKNLKRGVGAQDFMTHMDYLHSTPGIPNSQKNDSKNIFFEIREDAFEIVSEDIHTFIKKNVSDSEPHQLHSDNHFLLL